MGASNAVISLNNVHERFNIFFLFGSKGFVLQANKQWTFSNLNCKGVDKTLATLLLSSIILQLNSLLQRFYLYYLLFLDTRKERKDETKVQVGVLAMMKMKVGCFFVFSKACLVITACVRVITVFVQRKFTIEFECCMHVGLSSNVSFVDCKGKKQGKGSGEEARRKPNRSDESDDDRKKIRRRRSDDEGAVSEPEDSKKKKRHYKKKPISADHYDSDSN